MPLENPSKSAKTNYQTAKLKKLPYQGPMFTRMTGFILTINC